MRRKASVKSSTSRVLKRSFALDHYLFGVGVKSGPQAPPGTDVIYSIPLLVILIPIDLARLKARRASGLKQAPSTKFLAHYSAHH